jgi:hypothetical protein
VPQSSLRVHLWQVAEMERIVRESHAALRSRVDSGGSAEDAAAEQDKFA